MKKIVKLKESDIENIVKKIIKEDPYNRYGYRGGYLRDSPFKEVSMAVVDRYRIYRDEYKEALERFNNDWPLNSTKYRDIQPGE